MPSGEALNFTMEKHSTIFENAICLPLYIKLNIMPYVSYDAFIELLQFFFERHQIDFSLVFQFSFSNIFCSGKTELFNPLKAKIYKNSNIIQMAAKRKQKSLQKQSQRGKVLKFNLWTRFKMGKKYI